MFGFNPKNIRDFSDFRLSAKIVFIFIWNILFLLDFGFVLNWDIGGIEKILREELEIKSRGFIFIALLMGFAASIMAQKNDAFKKMIFKPMANAEDNEDLLKFLSFLLGVMAIGFFGYTIISYI